MRTESGSAVVALRTGGADVRPADPLPQGDTEIRLRQTTLVRLVLGALPPVDLLRRCEPHLGGEEQAWLEALFPSRQPYL